MRVTPSATVGPSFSTTNVYATWLPAVTWSSVEFIVRSRLALGVGGFGFGFFLQTLTRFLCPWTIFVTYLKPYLQVKLRILL